MKYSRKVVSLLLAAMLCVPQSSVWAANSKEAGEEDLARQQDAVMMADCPVVKEAVIRDNPKGSYLKVNDGDDATGWLSSSYDECLHKEHWLYADFITPKTFDQVKIVWDKDAYAKSYKIQVSNTGRDADWYDVAVVDNNQSGDEVVHEFDSTTARYVRVYIEEAKQESGVVGINTLSIFEKGSAPSAQKAVEQDLAFLTEDVLLSTNKMLLEISNADLKNVKASLNLPQTGFSSSSISWSVTPDDGGINVANGEIKRGSEDKAYKLKATVSKEDVSETKEFDITVKANVVTGAELIEGGNGHNYLTADGKPLPYINVQNCGMQHYILSDMPYEEQLEEAENLFEKTAALGYKRIGIIFKWKDFEPTNAGEYDWRVVDKYIEWCNKYDLYWDIVYFGSNSCGGSRLTDGDVSGGEWWMGNLPKYVDKYKGYFDNGVHSGAPMVKSPVLKGPNYEWIKTNEIRAVQDLMNHIAEVDINRRTACFQVMNEPYWHEMSRPYWQGNWSKNNEGEDRWVYDWISDMAVAIKASDYAIPTRINGSLGAYSPEQYTWLNNLPGIDFMGDDSYNSNVSVIEDNIVKNLEGSSFPHIAENNGRYANTSSLVLTTLVNGGGYHTWELPDDQGQGMAPGSAIDWELGKPATYYESGQDMGRLNPSINRISELVAAAPLDTMAAFNIDQNTPMTNYKEFTQLNGIYAGYECDDGSVAMAVKDDKAVYLVSDSASQGNGNVNFITYQKPIGASYGELNENGEWVVSQEVEITCGDDGIYRVPVKEGECVRVEFENAGLTQVEELKTSEGELQPEFNTYVHEYNMEVAADTAEIQFTANLSEENTYFTVDGIQYLTGSTSLPVSLQYGNNTIEVLAVWDGIGSVEENTYTIHVYREIPDQLTAEDIANTITNIPGIDNSKQSGSMIQVAGATAGSQWDDSINPKNVINNSGMSGTDSVNDTHDNEGNAKTMWHTRENPGENAWIQFDLGKSYALDEMWIWNMNQANCAGRGFKNVKIEYSEDGQNWNELQKPDNMEFQDASPEYPFQFAQSSGQPGQKATNLNDGNNSPVSFQGMNARYVKLTAAPTAGDGTWGENYYGLSEIRFTEKKEKQGDILLPIVPKGYKISIEKSSNEEIIDLEGNATPDSLDRIVMLTLRVTNTQNSKDTALTKALPVKVYSKKDTPQNVNLALQKPVIDVTGGETGEKASNAVDGDYLTRYVSAASIQNNPASFTVDLGSVMEFNQMVTMWEAARVSKYKLWVSDDNSNWKEVIKETELDHEGKQVDNFETVSGRYVKFDALKNGPNAGVFAIAELELYNRNLISEDYVLRDLKLNAGTLMPEFDTNTYAYTAIVGTETDSLTVTPIQKGKDATVKVNDKVVKNGEASENIPLVEGENLITVFVQDPDKEDCTAKYEIHITKKNYPTKEYQNVLLSKNVTCPGYGGGFWHPAENINDGNKGNYAQPNGGIADYQFDLQGTYTVDQFNIFTGSTNVINDFDIKVSLDGNEWVTVQSVKGYTPTSATYHFEPMNARYILLDNINGSSTAGINEVEAYGYPIEYNAKAVANNIRTLTVTSGQGQLTLPVVPDPYQVRIKSSSNETVIALDGTIIAGDEYEETDIVLEVSDGDKDTAETQSIKVVVLPQNLTCQNVAESIFEQVQTSIPKDVITVQLPQLPAGYTATYEYIEGEQDLLSFDGNILTVHPHRSNAAANYSLTVSRDDGSQESYTCESWLKFEVAGRSATTQELMDELMVETTQKAGTTFVLPEVPEGYQLEISSSSNQDVINLAGTIANIEQTMDVDLYLKLSKQSDGSATTKKFTITVLGSADRTELEKLIQNSEELLAKADEYTKESYTIFADAFREAKRVFAENASDQSQIDMAQQSLHKAIDQLEKVKPDNPVSKELLQKAYEYALTLSIDGATDSAKAFFEKALKNAEAVLAKEDAIQEEVNKAFDQLVEAIHGLGVVQGDKTNLGLLIDRANGMMAEADRYVQENWQQLVDALNAANDVMGNGDATPDIVEEATENLLNAILIQRYKANKDNLQDIIDQAERMDLSKYTKESVEVFKEALANAKEVLANESLSIDDQATVDQAYKDLDAAIKGLKLVSNDGNGNSNNETGGNHSADKNAPKTGDEIPFTLFMGIVLSLAVISCSLQRKKRK